MNLQHSTFNSITINSISKLFRGKAVLLDVSVCLGFSSMGLIAHSSCFMENGDCGV